MLAVIRRAVTLGEGHSVSINVRDLEEALEIRSEDLKGLLDDLARYDVGGWSEEDDNQYHAHVSDPSRQMGWLDLAEFCSGEGLDLRRLVVDRDFSILDD